MTMVKRDSMETTCPGCGLRYPLEATMVDHLEAQWRLRERAALKREIAPEVDAQATKKAEKLADARLRAKDEELRDATKQISSLRTQVTKLQRRLPSGRAQELGVARQETLADVLGRRFPSDEIRVIARGVAGGDVRHVVRGPGGEAGSILWESKRAANWSRAWVSKLEVDRRNGSYTLGVIVSDVLPDEDKSVVLVDGIWVCTLDAAGELALLLRQRILEVAAAYGAAALREDLKGQVYDYVTGGAFADRISSLVTTAIRLREEVEAERRAFKVKWAERDRCADAIVDTAATLWGDFRGLGALMPAIGALVLPVPRPSARPELPDAGAA
jgi:hypothetical protein